MNETISCLEDERNNIHDFNHRNEFNRFSVQIKL